MQTLRLCMMRMNQTTTENQTKYTSSKYMCQYHRLRTWNSSYIYFNNTILSGVTFPNIYFKSTEEEEVTFCHPVTL